MSEPKTVREYVGAVYANAKTQEAYHTIDCDDPILDYHIIPGTECVAAEADLLAAGRAYEDAHRAALDTNDYEAGLVAGARAVLGTLGIIGAGCVAAGLEDAAQAAYEAVVVEAKQPPEWHELDEDEQWLYIVAAQAVLVKAEVVVADTSRLDGLFVKLEETEPLGLADANVCRDIVIWVRETFGRRADVSKDGAGIIK